MSDVTTLPPHTAVLELPQDVSLSGTVHPEQDGQLELRGVRLVGGKGGSKLSLRLGAAATLRLPGLSDNLGDIGDTPVFIAGINGNNLQLTFAHADDTATVRRCLKALAAAASRGSAEPRPAAVQRSGNANQQLLVDFERQSLSRLEELFEQFLTELTDYLFEESVAPGRNSTALFESVRLLRHNDDKITRYFIDQIRDRFADLTPAKQSLYQQKYSGIERSSLDLVDLEEFEDSLALDRMVNAGRNRHELQLECLAIRLSAAIGADPQSVRLPVHVTELCTALQESLQNYDIEHSAIPYVFDYFVQHFLTKLDELYSPLNQILIDAGLCPGLEDEIRAKGSKLRHPTTEPERPKPRQEEVRDSAGNATKNALNDAIDDAVEQLDTSLSPEILYRSVIDALNFKRGGADLPDDAAPASSIAAGHTETPADTASLVQALATMQRNSDSRAEVQQSGSLRDYLTQNSAKITGLEDTAGFDADSMNQLDLIDSLFQTIRSQMDVSADLQPTMSELQVPLAKLALLEPGFFLNEGHPARGVVDKLSQLASAGNFPNSLLEERVGNIIGNIVEGYDRDSGVFDTALQQIDKLVTQQASAQARNVERVVKTQEGQERLRYARSQVDAAILDRLKTAEVPQILLDLIDKGWKELLVLTHVKEGPESENWHEHLRTLDLLVDWLADQQDGAAEDRAMQRGLESEPFVDMLSQQITSELPANLEIEPVFAELRQVLSGEKPVVTTTLDSSDYGGDRDSRHLRSRLHNTQRLRRWVDRVDQLETGSWLTYKDREGERRRMQLAWVNPDRDRFIFVNDRGQKVADLNAVQLARQLSRGAKPPSKAEGMSLVDQSMYGTLEQVQKSLSFSRNHDQLTKLLNRGTFIDQLSRALRHAHRKSSQHAVLHLNIDQFNLVNEVYDHISGDQVLTEFARLLSQLHGKKISSARLGDDDFGILLVDHTMSQALTVAESVRTDIEASSIDIDGEMVGFTVSIGVVPVLDYSPDVDTLLQSAEQAMKLAKERGRNQVAQYQESSDTIQRYQQDRKNTRLDLEQALAADRFVLRAQPIVHTAINSDQPVSKHYELLLGKREKDGSLGSPQTFIESAERHGLMTLVDRWVVREAFRWISQMMDAQKVVPNLAINLSGTSITDDDFMEYLFEQISEFGVGTNRLCFEITETGTITNLVKAADFVRSFRNIGCKFSLDDFGTGLASHNYLRELPVDYVKIDGTFITGIDDNPNDYTMARSINDLAHFLGQETIAESVENDRIIKRLEEIGVDYLQGWGIGHPRPLTEIADELMSIEK